MATQNSSTANTTDLDKLKKTIQEIEKTYTASTQPSASKDTTVAPTFEADFRTYDAPDDAEIEASAKQAVEADNQVKRSQIVFDTQTKSNALKNSAAAAERAYLQAEVDGKNYFDEARQSSSDSALKRGLARSSIAQFTQEAVNNAEATARLKLRTELSRELSSINGQLEQLTAERDIALDHLDIVSAAKLTQEINSLKTQRDNKQNEVQEYNNALKEKLAKLAIEQEKWAQQKEENEIKLTDLRSEQAKKEAEKLKEERDKAVYQSVSAYLGAMKPSVARKELSSNPYYRSVLSSYHYALINNALNARL